MYYGELKKCDIANGEGVRVSLFVSGCRNRCRDCFQPETWDFCFGQPFTQETAQEIYAELNTKSDYCQVCGWDGEIEVVEEDGKLIWKCPQ